MPAPLVRRISGGFGCVLVGALLATTLRIGTLVIRQCVLRIAHNDVRFPVDLLSGEMFSAGNCPLVDYIRKKKRKCLVVNSAYGESSERNPEADVTEGLLQLKTSETSCISFSLCAASSFFEA